MVPFRFRRLRCVLRYWIALEILGGSFFLIQLPIDHKGNYEGTFENRYWYNATFYKPGGPVFRTLPLVHPAISLHPAHASRGQFLMLGRVMPKVGATRLG